MRKAARGEAITVDRELREVILERLSDPETVGIVRRALAQGVVLDTWMHGEDEERMDEGALAALAVAAEHLTEEALLTEAVFPRYPMPQGYVRAAFHELLSSTALFVAQQRKGRREVALPEAREAVERLSRFVGQEPERLTAAGVLFGVISAHEDLNAIAYYGRMGKEDFLLGRLHRPWSNLVLSDQLELYLRAGLVEEFFTGDGQMVALTEAGRDVLDRLHRVLREAGELEWRSNNQRWVIFSELSYDEVINRVSPDAAAVTRAYLESLGLRPGTRVLEVGAGTGRATVDLGLSDLVAPGGEVVALDPSAVLLQKLERKCRERGVGNVRAVQGVAEELPFPDGSFDAAVAVASLHFTDAPRAVAEMVRVTRPGGLVSAAAPPPEFDVRKIPVVAQWFQPLTTVADHLGVPFGERRGFPPGVLERLFREAGLAEVRLARYPLILSAEDHRAFLAFFLKGAAFFQNILCRLPYAERWAIIRRLEEMGDELAATTPPEEKRHVFEAEAVYGRVPGR